MHDLVSNRARGCEEKAQTQRAYVGNKARVRECGRRNDSKNGNSKTSSVVLLIYGTVYMWGTIMGSSDVCMHVAECSSQQSLT